MWDDLGTSLGALIPSIGVLAVFLLVVRAMVLADRRERSQRLREEALLDRELRERAAGEAAPGGPGASGVADAEAVADGRVGVDPAGGAAEPGASGVAPVEPGVPAAAAFPADSQNREPVAGDNR
ncbi:MAG: hypothetical protein J0H73_04535 [Salana multivorans]|nr:hypothetical protein [Salana multivorans]OJX97476.1 MAG: hypothetical protein BGO96_06130 [Micrococcales bacterium 73-15]